MYVSDYLRCDQTVDVAKMYRDGVWDACVKTVTPSFFETAPYDALMDHPVYYTTAKTFFIYPIIFNDKIVTKTTSHQYQM